LWLCVVTVLMFGSAAGFSQEIRVAAAADLTPVMPVLAAAYEKATGVKVVASFGSSATLTEQIKGGLPVDVFLSADVEHPAQLVSAGLAESEPRVYARGVLVLWARKDSVAQPIGMDSLKKPSVTRVAVANPAHAPYGLAAQETLVSLHLAAEVVPKMVTAENIAQTAQFAETGNAQCGFISMTTANTTHFREVGTFAVVPENAYKTIRQAAIVVRSSKNADAGRAFLKWLVSPAVQAQLKTMGLEPAK
jgi:molybdate transport system substrate-binding protein